MFNAKEDFFDNCVNKIEFLRFFLLWWGRASSYPYVPLFSLATSTVFQRIHHSIFTICLNCNAGIFGSFLLRNSWWTTISASIASTFLSPLHYTSPKLLHELGLSTPTSFFFFELLEYLILFLQASLLQSHSHENLASLTLFPISNWKYLHYQLAIDSHGHISLLFHTPLHLAEV